MIRIKVDTRHTKYGYIDKLQKVAFHLSYTCNNCGSTTDFFEGECIGLYCDSCKEKLPPIDNIRPQTSTMERRITIYMGAYGIYN